ncbi:MAG: hypothetical protein IT437_01805 [Phycisphaerales bacterium]|nr:hypothetical protein [Phycisphaerales bacterium]
MTRPLLRACAVLPALVLTAGHARGQVAQKAVESPKPDDGRVFKSQSDWVLLIEPSMWYQCPGGELRLPGGGDKMGFKELNLDSPRPSPTIEVSLRDDKWRFVFGASQFATDDRGVIAESPGRIGDVAFAAGDALSSSMDYTTVEMSAGYDFFRRQLSVRKQGGFNYVANAEVLGGIRLHDVSFDVSSAAATASADQFFAEPFAGLRFGVDLAEDFSIDVTVTLGAFSDGGGRQAFSWDSVAGFRWYPVRNVAVQGGYRQLALSLSSGDGADEFEWTGATAGLFVGLSIMY